MDKTIKQIFDEHLKGLVLDQAFFKKIKKYGQEFVYRNDEHVNFFGSNLTGVYAVRFKTSDRNDWLIDILDLDETAVRKEIIKLPSVKSTWVRGTDVMNLSCLYLTHRIMSNTTINIKDRHEAAMNVLMVLHYKLIGSLMAHNFKYAVDERLAQMTYANMSKKFSIKQLGSWYKVLEARCADILSSSSIHKQTIARFDDDAAIQRMITDVQGRLKNMIKKIWKLFEEVRSQDNKLMSVSGMVDIEGKAVIRDLLKSETPFIRYLDEIVTDDRRFIKKELIVVIGDVMQTMSTKLLTDVLGQVVVKARAGDPKVKELMSELLLHAFEYFNKDRFSASKLNDLGTLLIKFRSLYMASRSKEAKLLRMRELAEGLAEGSVNSKNPTVIASLRTGLMLYIILRTFAKDHYD